MRFKVFVFFIVCSSILNGQDLNYTKRIIDTLCSENMHGRGYVNSGDKIAANFIAEEFKGNNVKAFDNNYFQTFTFPINTFPDTVSMIVNGKKLIPGTEFMVSSNSPSVKGSYRIVNLARGDKPNFRYKRKLKRKDLSNKFILADSRMQKTLRKNKYDAKGVIKRSNDKLWWYVSNATRQVDYIELTVDSSAIPDRASEIELNINAEFIEEYETQNVIGYIEGKSEPDSFIVFTSHYDHLGRMGSEVYFPGANDNASGVSLLLNLAKYYSQPENQPDCSIAFMAFTAEEVGLLGSYYYSENPLFPLESIRFVVNLDLTGTGDDGIKVVNGAVLKKEFELLKKINEDKGYLKKVEPRGEAANSDHYFFYKNGVRSFFIYTLGGITEYHNIHDKAETLPLTEYSNFYKLLIDFVEAL